MESAFQGDRKHRHSLSDFWVGVPWYVKNQNRASVCTCGVVVGAHLSIPWLSSSLFRISISLLLLFFSWWIEFLFCFEGVNGKGKGSPFSCELDG
ncbi:hypothetical protein Tsubulata_048499, partial [Turnera subulata]